MHSRLHPPERSWASRLFSSLTTLKYASNGRWNQKTLCCPSHCASFPSCSTSLASSENGLLSWKWITSLSLSHTLTIHAYTHKDTHTHTHTHTHTPKEAMQKYASQKVLRSSWKWVLEGSNMKDSWNWILDRRKTLRRVCEKKTKAQTCPLQENDPPRETKDNLGQFHNPVLYLMQSFSLRVPRAHPLPPPRPLP